MLKKVFLVFILAKFVDPSAATHQTVIFQIRLEFESSLGKSCPAEKSIALGERYGRELVKLQVKQNVNYF